MSTSQIASSLTNAIINPLIALIFAAGLLVFVWGLIEFLWGLNGIGDSTKKEEGKMHMLWGILGMFVMVAAFSILTLLANNICGTAPANCASVSL